MKAANSIEDGAVPPRVLMLFSEICANGGIQRFNQTVLDCCGRLGVGGLVLSLQDGPGELQPYRSGEALRIEGFSGDRRRFAFAVARALCTGRFDRILIGHVNFLVMTVAIMALCPIRQGTPLLIAHGIEVWSGIGRARRLALSRMGRILCVSRYTRQRLLEQAPGLAAERLVLFPNALAGGWGANRAAVDGPDLPARFILSVTRLETGDRYKGIPSVIEAFSMLADHDLEYVVVGRGGDLPFLREVAARNGVAHRVRFLTDVDDAQLAGLYEKCLAFVLPSGKEGFGIVYLEAMFHGAPVVAARERGATDVVRDGETGLSVRFGDSVAVKDAIERLCTDCSLREHLRNCGRALVTGSGPFTFDAFTERLAAALS